MGKWKEFEGLIEREKDVSMECFQFLKKWKKDIDFILGEYEKMKEDMEKIRRVEEESIRKELLELWMESFHEKKGQNIKMEIVMKKEDKKEEKEKKKEIISFLGMKPATIPFERFGKRKLDEMENENEKKEVNLPKEKKRKTEKK
jgi:hypothetical protein